MRNLIYSLVVALGIFTIHCKDNDPELYYLLVIGFGIAAFFAFVLIFLIGFKEDKPEKIDHDIYDGY